MGSDRFADFAHTSRQGFRRGDPDPKKLRSYRLMQERQTVQKGVGTNA